MASAWLDHPPLTPCSQGITGEAALGKIMEQKGVIDNLATRWRTLSRACPPRHPAPRKCPVPCPSGEPAGGSAGQVRPSAALIRSTTPLAEAGRRLPPR